MPSRDLGVPNTRHRILLENRGRNCQNNFISGIHAGFVDLLFLMHSTRTPESSAHVSVRRDQHPEKSYEHRA
jgi:hypothetical protein